MVMGVPPPDSAAQHVGRNDALATGRQPDAATVRAAEQMHAAGLKYRPAMITPTVWVVIGILVVLGILAVVSS
ncbi:MAG TPA: hypothetical protein VNQ77_12600 [Frankiaceae bacterium]|nr:hypothetical protein [Frankiaceae bacterium]